MRLKSLNITYGEQFFKALADETRIRMLYLLFNNKELTISDFELILEFTQTKTARHLTYLKSAGIVSSRKLDQWVFYYIKDEAKDIIHQVFNFLKNDSVLDKDQRNYDVLFSNRELSINKVESKRWKS